MTSRHVPRPRRYTVVSINIYLHAMRLLAQGKYKRSDQWAALAAKLQRMHKT